MIAGYCRSLHVRLLALILLAHAAIAQQGPPPGLPPGPPPGGEPSQQRTGRGPHTGGSLPGEEHGQMSRGGPPNAEGQMGTVSTMRGGLQLGPPGRWWSDAAFAASLHLRPDQQSRMNKVFAENRDAFFARYDDLKQRENELEALTRTTPISEPAIFAGIDKVASARATLEKANAHMQLQLRMQLTQDQVKMLDEHRPGPPR